MDMAAVRRGVVDRSDRQGPKLIAVIIGEALLPTRLHGGRATVVGPLSPLSPSPRIPAALLPVCNTPVIDYVLENLVLNGVDEATILLNSSSAAKTIAHLSECRTARGKPWMLSDSINVTVVECARRISTLADAADEMRERNVVPQNGSFLLVPIDTVASFTNLRACYQTHLERVRKVSKYAATLLCVSSRSALAAALRNSLMNHLAEAEEVSSQSPVSPIGGSGRHGVLSIRQTSEMLRLRNYTAPVLPRERHTMFVLNKATQVVTYMARFENGEEAPEPPAVAFSSSAPQSVRMDLLPTGYMFCCCEALSLIEFHIRDLYSFLSTSLLGQTEIYGNVFGLIELPSSSAVLEPINSAEAYIQCNLDVCARRLFPMTRESCFAEELAKYAVSSTCETVYLHTTARCASSSLMGPNVVVGEEVSVPASVELAGTVLGARVELGDEASLRSCVVMEGARIGRRCVLHGCLIGPHAVIGDGAELSYVVVGERCVLDGVTISGAPLVLQHQAIECDVDDISGTDEDGVSRGDEGEEGSSSSSLSSSSEGAVGHKTDKLLTGANGRGHALEDRYSSNILPTSALFTEDPVARPSQSDDEGESSEEDDEQVLFRRSIQRHVQAALLQPSRIESSSYDMSTICLSSGFGYPELCEIVTELLMEHLLSTHRDESPANIVEAARDMFHTWCRPFYSNFLSKNQQPNMDAMVATLEGLCGAIGGENCPLRCYGPQLVEILYYGCEDDLYNERGYCIVSGESLIAFDAEMEHRREVLQRYTAFKGGRVKNRGAARLSSSNSDTSSSSSSSTSSGDDEESRDLHEEGKVLVAVSCHDFIMGVKDFLEAE
ncbi:Translation initiation factor eIF-2B subunit epsilon, putative [Leishmania donovani]|uniref:Translation initiation factor eIF-2B subunit epsilon, putative n=1 Tax=Leishmania donovani TaxID=5661 RepID=A0A3Q8IDY2_LEIDO|nr:Translation initiation factor eIF-2B subunit epsilon, putative [Leishmania donovani]